MATLGTAQNLGFTTPTGGDDISGGDNAITANALAAVDLFDAARAYASTKAQDAQNAATQKASDELTTKLQTITGYIDYGPRTGTLQLDTRAATHVITATGPLTIELGTSAPNGTRILIVIRAGGGFVTLKPDAWLNDKPTFGDSAAVEIRRVFSTWVGLSAPTSAPSAEQTTAAIEQASQAITLARDANTQVTNAVTSQDTSINQVVTSTSSATRTSLNGIYALAPKLGSRAVGAGEITFLVDDYGAVGDGVADDLAAIKAARAAASASGRAARLRFTKGKTYAVSGTWDPAGLIVDASGATLIALAGVTSFNMLQPSGAFIWNGGTIDGNKSKTTKGSTGSGFSQSGTWSAHSLTDVTVKNHHFHGVQFLGGTTAITSPMAASSGTVALTRVTASSCAGYGINLQRISTLRLTDCTATDCTNSGAVISLCRDVTVRGGNYSSNTATSGTHGILLMYVTDVRLDAVTADSNGNSGICFGGGTAGNAPSTNCRVNACSTNGNNYHGLDVDLTITGQAGVNQPWHSTVTGHIATGNGYHGIYVQNSGSVTISGALVKDNQKCGAMISSPDVVLTGHRAINNGTLGVDIAAYGNGVVIGAGTSTGNGIANYKVETSVSSAPVFTQTTTTVPA